MNNSAKTDAARERHQTLDLIGLRAHATAVGLIQLCEELLNAGVLSAAGLDRIKDAICSELTVAKRARVSKQWDLDDTLRQRIDAVFPAASGAPARENVGPIEDFEDALTGYHGA
ncbi:MAG TPA: hypothetical protein VN034_14320 [Sphingopyxis sp.]|nr:hypothetical protein [Sphingopyxis sp.]